MFKVITNPPNNTEGKSSKGIWNSWLVHATTLPGRAYPDQEEPPPSGTPSSTKSLQGSLLLIVCTLSQDLLAWNGSMADHLSLALWFQSWVTPAQTFSSLPSKHLGLCWYSSLRGRAVFFIAVKVLSRASRDFPDPVFQLWEVACIKNRGKNPIIVWDAN